MGNPFGRADDAVQQRRILDRALRLFHEAAEPGRIVDFPDQWDRDFTDVVDRTLGAMAGPTGG